MDKDTPKTMAEKYDEKMKVNKENKNKSLKDKFKELADINTKEAVEISFKIDSNVRKKLTTFIILFLLIIGSIWIKYSSTKSVDANLETREELNDMLHMKNLFKYPNYDDVMNTQREIIYKQRAQVLDGEDLHKDILKMMEDLITSTVDTYLADEDERENWNIVGLKEYFLGWLIDEEDLTFTEDELKTVTREEIANALNEKCGTIYQAKEEEYGSEIIREVERVILLKVVDTKWMAHIDDMEELKKGIGLRGYGQKNPVIEYRYEGFEMFDAMVESIREDTVRALMTVKLRKNEAPEREQVAKPDAPNAGAGDGSFSEQATSSKIKDNDPCPCGSGKKFKNCHGRGM